MELRREINVTVGSLVLLNLGLAFGCVGLFVRMGPAVQRIMQENVYSISAAEDILEELARNPEGPIPQASRARIREAIARARTNVTESEETPILDALATNLDPTLAGDNAARQRSIDEVRNVIRINRQAMRSADGEAKRLGIGGAWATVLVGFIAFALSLVVMGRLRRRIVQPIEELFGVLIAAREGAQHRRCRAGSAPTQLEQVAQSINALLDQRAAAAAEQQTAAPEVDSAALRFLLDRLPQGGAVTDVDGHLLRASCTVLDALSGPRGETLREQLRVGAAGLHDHQVVNLSGGLGYLWILGAGNRAQPQDATGGRQQTGRSNRE